MYDKYSQYMKVEYYDLEPARIVVEGNSAVVHYYFSYYSTFEMGDMKEEEEVKGRNADFMIKQNGKWMLLGDMSYATDEDDDDDDD